jgi:heat shock protein HslJ
MRRFWPLILWLILGLCLSACRSTGPQRALDQLIGTSWQLQDAGAPAIPADVRTTLAFQRDGGITGQAGCNLYFATCRLDGEDLTISALGSTRKICPPTVMEHEDRFLSALKSARRMVINDAQLLIFSEGTEVPLRFTPLGN